MKQIFYFLMCAFCLQAQGQVYPIELEGEYERVRKFHGGLADVELNNKYGFIDKRGKEIVPCIYEEPIYFSEGLAIVKLNDKYGFIDKTGKEIVPCIYEYQIGLSGFSEGLALVKSNDKYGFINKKGEEVIPCKYDYAEKFSEDMALVRLDGKYGFIDKTGKGIIPCAYDGAYHFSEGLAWVERGGKYGFIDKKGNVVIPCKYDVDILFDFAYKSFSNGLAKVELNGKWGFIDKKGNVVIPCKYDSNIFGFGSFSDGLAWVKLNGKYGFIDKTGKEITPCKYDSDIFGFNTFSDGLAIVKSNGKYGFIDKTGKEITPCKYDAVGHFSEGLAKVKLNGEWGFIDKTGREVISCKYEGGDDFSKGLAIVKSNDKYGFINKEGKEVIPCKYDYAENFSEELASVKLDGRYGFIDKTGKEIIPLIYDQATPFSEGIAAVKKGSKWYLIQNPLLQQKCTSLTWHTPNLAELENATYRLSEDSLFIKLNYDCETPLQPQDFVVYIDEQAVAGEKAHSVQLKGKSFQTVLGLPPGKHKVEIAAGGKCSSPLWVQFEGKPHLFLYSVGIPSDLDFPTKDAKDIVEIFEKQRGILYDDVHPTLLAPEKAYEGKIKGDLKGFKDQFKIKEIHDWDIMVIFISTHGILKGDMLYLQCLEYVGENSAKFEETTLSWKELSDILNAYPCKKLVLLDACHSGAAKGKDAEIIQKNLDSLSLRLDITTVLSSSKANELSYEDKKWENGAFTQAVLEGLSGKAEKDKIGSEGYGYISIDELIAYTTARVPEMIRELAKTNPRYDGKTQTPNPTRKDKGWGNLNIYKWK